MEAALSAADQGFKVFLVERADHLGGVANHLLSTAAGEAIVPHLETMVNAVTDHPEIFVYLNAEVQETSGIMGSFTTRVRVGTPDRESDDTLNHGATVLATGGHEYQPEEYLYGKHPAVFTHLDMNRELVNEDSPVHSANQVVFIQCVGSRNPQRPYCSKICCTNTMAKAIHLKEANPETQVVVLYRDIRTYGTRETLYTKARNLGVLFIRYDEAHPPEVFQADGGGLRLWPRTRSGPGDFALSGCPGPGCRRYSQCQQGPVRPVQGTGERRRLPQ